MDQRLPAPILLLLTLGVFIAAKAQNGIRCTAEQRPRPDEQECDRTWICPQSVSCDQKSKCRCKAGYYKCKRQTRILCVDSNECKRKSCGPGAVCRNTHGSYYCECLTNRPNAQFCPTEGTAYCEENKVRYICNMNSEQREKLEECGEKKTQVAKQQLDTMAGTISRVLGDKNDSSTFSTAHTSELLNSVESAALISFGQAPRTQMINTPKLDISMKSSSDGCNSTDHRLSLMAGMDNMEIPCNLLLGERDGAVFIVYKDLASHINGNFLSKTRDPEDNDRVLVNSRVVSGTTSNWAAKTFSHPVVFRLIQIKPLRRFHKLYCAYWDLQNNGWSDEGCTTEDSNHTHTTCSCSHLSSLAVIMAPSELEEDFILSIITYVGLSVSLVCLCLSLLTFILCRSLRSIHTSVLAAMSGCLFLAQLLALAGLSQTKNKVVCSIIAGGLHYLFLCTFSWMSIESVLLFMTVRNLRAVNYMTSRRSNFPVMCLLAFGVPTVIVGITVAVRYHQYCSFKYCWLHPRLVWSFLGPACVFISTNTILLIFTVLLLRRRLATLNTNVSTLKNTRLLTFKALAQALILGCTWSIGCFQFGSFSQIMSYLFTICNSPQGAYIFIVHCLLNHQVRGEYRKFFSRKKKQEQEISTLQTPSRSEVKRHFSKRVLNVFYFIL
ncbi:PREDICTED: adhesion G protein-coupled receptor E3-like [Nanorana parkeri]|uniref:adhesion G protein-coupled receptor E3-like n=1 Tax=Nanorana parkeri TaxID=125878 RepID=UPI0008549527|nr:PREDICTED: adhesion G protein-coupled receptor E3-like [Nanorana parkeri]